MVDREPKDPQETQASLEKMVRRERLVTQVWTGRTEHRVNQELRDRKELWDHRGLLDPKE